MSHSERELERQVSLLHTGGRTSYVLQQYKASPEESSEFGQLSSEVRQLTGETRTFPVTEQRNFKAEADFTALPFLGHSPSRVSCRQQPSHPPLLPGRIYFKTHK